MNLPAVPVLAEAATSQGDGEARESTETDRPATDHRALERGSGSNTRGGGQNIWSYKAKLLHARFSVEELTKFCGTLFEWDHLRALPKDEYEFWMNHPLPMGWSIISPPCKRDEQV